MDLLYISHAQLTAFVGVILGIAGCYAIIWSLQAMNGVRLLRTKKGRK
ncbi:MAG: hypothetical protein K8R90_03045 [Candidatus Cloacimonetes bacterium]|nr:hypothetical protein [Candidatus Cloacimonadota bacterium]